MEEVDIKFICFDKRCVSNREQIFAYDQRRKHAGHWENVRMFNSKEMNELIQVRGRYVRDACQWAKQHLFGAISSMMNRLHLPAEDKYQNATKDIVTSTFSSLLGQNKNLVEHFQQGLQQDNKLWLLNNIYQGNEKIIKEGIQIETLLLTKEITQQLRKQWEIMAEELVCQNVSILSSFLDEPKTNVKEKQIPKSAELIEIHQQVSNMIEKTKPIKKRGRQPRQISIQEKDDDSKEKRIKLEPSRLKLFEINQKKDMFKGVPCDRLVINYQIPEAKVIELISKLRPFQIVNNAQMSFSSSFLQKIPIQIQRNLILLLQYWDFKDYYERITDYLYFYSQKRDSVNYKKQHMTSQNWKYLPNLKNLWIGSTQDLAQVKKANLKYNRFSSLTIFPCLCCKKKPLPAHDILQELNPIINLDTLVLSRININKESANKINNFIRNNTYLTCVVINYSGSVGNGFIQAISKLKLTKLFICNQDHPEEDLDYRPIFSIESIQYLTLQRTRLTIEALQEIWNLKNLVHLDIYNSYPVHPRILENLHPNTYSSLVHLNLGYCELEDLNVGFLRKFKVLKNLNLDGSLFNCQKVMEQLVTNPILSVIKLSMFNYHDEPLRLRQCRDKFSMNNEIIAMIAKAFPNLVYLAIGYDCMITELDLDQFKKLKTFLANQKCTHLIISKDTSKNCIMTKEKFLN